MRIVHHLFFAVLVLLLSGCGFTSVKGSGNVTSESRSVSGVTEVSVSGSAQVIIVQTGNETLTITADDNLLPYLSSDVRGSKLELGTKDRTNINPTKEVVYRLEVKTLEAVEIAGSVSVEARGISTDRLSVVAAGETRIAITGQAERQDVSIAGSGEYQAADLKSKEVKISIAGSANAVLSVSEELNATITGEGTIEYIGDPEVTKTVMGAATIRKR